VIFRTRFIFLANIYGVVLSCRLMFEMATKKWKILSQVA